MFTKRHVPSAIKTISLTGEMVYVGCYLDLFDSNYNLNVNCDLIKIYPELLKIKIKTHSGVGAMGAKGIFNSNDNEIELYVDSCIDVAGTLVHELQHAIQELDGRAGGSNPAMYVKKANYLLGDKYRAISARAGIWTPGLVTKEEKEVYKLVGKVVDNWKEFDKYVEKDIEWCCPLLGKCYLACQGEIEARTASAIYNNQGANYNFVTDYDSRYLNIAYSYLNIKFINTELKFDDSLISKLETLVDVTSQRKTEHQAYLNSFMKVVEEEVEVTLEDSLDLIEEHYLNKFGEESYQRMQRPRTNYTKGRKPAKA